MYRPIPSGQLFKSRHVAPYIGQPYIITMDIVNFIWSVCFSSPSTYPEVYTSYLIPSPHPFIVKFITFINYYYNYVYKLLLEQ